jgi:hypothetical protein
MSQRWYRTPTHDVLTGWDRPLSYHFLVIWKRGEADTGEPIYTNLDDTEAKTGKTIGGFFGAATSRGLTLEQVEQRAAQYGCPLPAEVKQRLEEDQRADRGNLVSYHGYDGVSTEERPE